MPSLFSLPLFVGLLALLSLFSFSSAVLGGSVLVTSALVNPYGIVYDGAAYLYVSDSATLSIIKMTTAGVIVGNFSFNPALSDPRGLGIDLSGNLYLTDRASGRVVKFSPTGQQLAVYGPINPTLSFPFGVTVDPNFNIYVAASGSDNIMQINQAGAVVATSPAGILKSPYGVTNDLQGNFYICNTGSGTIVKKFANGTYTTFFSGGLNFPESIVVDFLGNVFVADTNNGRVVMINKFGAQVNVFTATPAFTFVTGVTLDSQGNLYATDINTGRVVKFINATQPTPPPSSTSSMSSITFAPTSVMVTPPTPTSAPVVPPTGPTVINSGLSTPYGITFDGTYLYVSDPGSLSVIKMTTAGVVVANFSSFNPPLLDPRGMGVDPAGSIYVTDTAYSRILKISNTGSQMAVYGPVNTYGLVNVTLNAPTNSTLSIPFGVTVDPFFNIWIADSGADNIVQMNQNNLITGASPSGILKSPYGITSDPFGNVYVADTQYGNVIKRSFNGSYSVMYSGLNFPEAIAVDYFGNVFVADTNNGRVVAISAAGVQTAIYTASNPSFGFVTGVTLDNLGNLYVVDISHSRVVKFANVTRPTPVQPQFSGSMCYITYGLPGDIDYPWSSAVSLQFQYTTPLLANFNAVTLVSGTGTRTYTNRYGSSFTTAITVSRASDNVMYLNNSHSFDLSGLSIALASPTQLPGLGPTNLVTLVQLTQNGSGPIFEGQDALIDPLGQAIISSVPGFVNLTIGAGNVNALAATYPTCTAAINFNNGFRQPPQPSASNGGTRINYTYTITDGSTYSVSTTLFITTDLAFANAKDQLGNNYQTVVSITGTRNYTYFLNFTTPGANTTMGPNITMGTSIISTVSGPVFNTTDRFYPYAFINSGAGVYTTNNAPFLDGQGLTFTISPATPLTGNAPGVGPTTATQTVAYQTYNNAETQLNELNYAVLPNPTLQQQLYTFSR